MEAIGITEHRHVAADARSYVDKVGLISLASGDEGTSNVTEAVLLLPD